MRAFKSMITALIIIMLVSCSSFGASVHEVSKRDSLYQIASWYGVDLWELSKTNNLVAPFTIYPGQIIIVPEQKIQRGEKIYKVQPGDTLYTIAKANNTTTAEISSLNAMGPELYVGQNLRLPAPPPPPPTTQAATPKVAAQPKQGGYYYALPDLMRNFPGRILLKGSSAKKQVALTFDDGPDGVFTPKILDLLAYHGVPATFFLRGDQVAGHSEVVKRIFQEGHLLASHSWSHPDLRKLSADAVKWQLEATAAEIKKYTGKEPLLVRPPYGEMTQEGMEQLIGLDYYLVNWSADSGDWQAKERDQVLIKSIPDAKPGAIVLMHCAGGAGQSLEPTIEALPYLIYTLRVQGYQFVTVDKLLNLPAYRKSS